MIVPVGKAVEDKHGDLNHEPTRFERGMTATPLVWPIFSLTNGPSSGLGRSKRLAGTTTRFVVYIGSRDLTGEV